jgi:nucleoid-associated protein YgaU
MRVSGPARGPSCVWRKAIVSAILLFSFCAMQMRGQDVAEAARQEKARKAAQQKSPRHVYTEEDLKRQVILTPEDQARVEARKHQQNAAPAELNAEQKLNDTNPQNESLGEIARRYREEKAARESEEAVKKKFTLFSYEVPQESHAAPKPGVSPLVPPDAGVRIIGRAPAPLDHSESRLFPPTIAPRRKFSPFQPRPLNIAPSDPRTALAAVPARPTRPANPARPSGSNATAPLISEGMRRIEVQRGQSWWKLAEHYLGSGARWMELRKLNRDARGPVNLLRLGSTVILPEATRAQEVSMKPTVKVRKGDSLWSLAHEYLGQGSAWTCLASANPQLMDYTHMAIGTTVELPTGEALRSCRNRTVKKFQK